MRPEGRGVYREGGGVNPRGPAVSISATEVWQRRSMNEVRWDIISSNRFECVCVHWFVCKCVCLGMMSIRPSFSKEKESGCDVRQGVGQRGSGGQPALGAPQCPEEGGVQKDRSPLGVEARDEPLSMLSEPELWCCCSDPALEVTVEEEVEEERIFSLKSVMITVTLPTVIASCWAVLRSTFFSLGLSITKRLWLTTHTTA